MQEIDIEKWKRKAHFQFFSQIDYPQYNICFNLDITKFIYELKNRKLPFYYSMIFYSTLCANEIEEFRYRNREGKVILHERLHPSFTDMEKDDDLFKIVTVDMKNRLTDFIREAKEQSIKQKDYFAFAGLEGRDDFIYFTSVPWISFTHLSHTIRLDKSESVPRLSWGKYYEENGKVILPYSVQVNHSFVDGIHVSRYKEILEEKIEKLDAF